MRSLAHFGFELVDTVYPSIVSNLKNHKGVIFDKNNDYDYEFANGVVVTLKSNYVFTLSYSRKCVHRHLLHLSVLRAYSKNLL